MKSLVNLAEKYNGRLKKSHVKSTTLQGKPIKMHDKRELSMLRQDRFRIRTVHGKRGAVTRRQTPEKQDDANSEVKWWNDKITEAFNIPLDKNSNNCTAANEQLSTRRQGSTQILACSNSPSVKTILRRKSNNYVSVSNAATPINRTRNRPLKKMTEHLCVQKDIEPLIATSKQCFATQTDNRCDYSKSSILSESRQSQESPLNKSITGSSSGYLNIRPQKMVIGVSESINRMLENLPDHMSEMLVDKFNFFGPMTSQAFTEVSLSYNLPLPPLEEAGMAGSLIKRKRDMVSGNLFLGQFSVNTKEKRGIIRKFSRKGDYASEQLVMNGKRIGLSRHMDSTGCIIYLVQDQSGNVIESQFYDPTGKQVKPKGLQPPPCITLQFWQWVFGS